GRSITLTLPRRGMISANTFDSRPGLDRMITGSSDHMGCAVRQASSCAECVSTASSDRMMLSAPPPGPAHSPLLPGHTAQAMSTESGSLAMASPSAGVSGSTRMRARSALQDGAPRSSGFMGGFPALRFPAHEGGHAGQHAMEGHQWFADPDSPRVHVEF